MSTDEALARRAQQGDRDAFLALYERYLDRVYRRVCSRVPPQYAEDVTQDVFMAVFRSIRHFEHNARFSTWLYTIVNRQIADFYRRRNRHGDPAAVSLDAVEDKPLAGTEGHERGDERALLQGILAALPEHYQEVILMRFADGLTFNEIAEARGQSLEAVKSLYRRAIQAIRDAIGD
jgi:RNA polymerase sigma-70 factor (ECF subfamily)